MQVWSLQKGGILMSRWYNIYIPIKNVKEALRLYLHEIGVYFEISGCGDGWHFEVRANMEEVALINNYINNYLDDLYEEV